MFCDGHGHASGFGRLRAFGAGLFALEVSGASLAFFDFIVLPAHKSLLSENNPVV